MGNDENISIVCDVLAMFWNILGGQLKTGISGQGKTGNVPGGRDQ